MSQDAVSFRPSRDVRRVRISHRVQLGLGLMWLLWGLGQIIASDDTVVVVIGAALMLTGAAMVVLSVLIRRTGVDIDEQRLRWRGLVRSETIPWSEVERVLLENRGSPYGTKIGIELRLKDGRTSAVPTDALDGLAEPAYAPLRDRLLATTTRLASHAGVSVVSPGPGDPLVP